MNSLRLRLTIVFCLFGLLPMLVLLLVVEFVDYGKIPFIAALALFIVCIFVGKGVAHFLVKPFTDLLQDFEAVVSGGAQGLSESSLFPELRKIRRALGILLTDQRNAKSRLEEIVNQRTSKLEESQDLLRRTNGFLSATFDSSPDGILVVGPDGRLITANRRFVERFDLPEEVIEGGGGSLGDAICHQFQDSELIRRRWDYYSENLEHSAEEEWEVMAPEPRTYYVFTAPVVMDDQRPFARLWIFRDKTQQKNLEYGLQQAQKMEAVGRLAGGIAHDFNNLLTAISGNLSLAILEGGPENDQIQDRLSNAQKATERAIDLVKQMLGYSRKSHLIIAKSNLNLMVEEVKSILRHSLDPRIEITLDLQGDLWDAQVDSTQIQQVVINMCVNARDAMPEHGGEIVLATRNVTLTDEDIEGTGNLVEAGEFVAISVQDNGEGIPPQLQDRIFEPFFTTKDPGSGTGLGLAMSFGIIRQHDGWIDFASEVGEGTEFVLYLPRNAREIVNPEGDGDQVPPVFHSGDSIAADAPGTGNIAAPPVAIGPISTGGVVLIVDDEDSVRAIGEGVLRHHGYDVLTASDGVLALEQVAEHGDEIDAIMLDLTMPTLSGKDTFKCLNDVGCEIPVLICSGFLVDLDEFSLETGGRPAGFLQKPYKIEGLAAEIRRVIDTRVAPTLPAPSEDSLTASSTSAVSGAGI